MPQNTENFDFTGLGPGFRRISKTNSLYIIKNSFSVLGIIQLGLYINDSKKVLRELGSSLSFGVFS